MAELGSKHHVLSYKVREVECSTYVVSNDSLQYVVSKAKIEIDIHRCRTSMLSYLTRPGEASSESTDQRH